MKIKRFGPIALTTTLGTNLLNPPTASGGVNAGSSANFIVVRRVHVVNTTEDDLTFSVWLGATGANAAGTEIYSEQVVPAHDIFEDCVALRLDSTDFLVGGASDTGLVLLLEGEQGVAG